MTTLAWPLWPPSTVPRRAAGISLLALTAAIGVATLWPQELQNGGTLACILALAPALLLAYYRAWTSVSMMLGLGILLLSAAHLSLEYFAITFDTAPFAVLVVGPYVAIALGAGWFGEIRRYQADLRATHQQLIQSDKLDSVGRMAAGIAHEVKNPLMTILTGVKILSKRMASADEPTRLLLDDMAEAVARADKIIGGLLAYCRNSVLDVAPGSLNATIGRALLLMKHTIEAQHIIVTNEFDDTLPAIPLDDFKLQQVFINLFSNAIHAMGEGGRLSVRTCRETVTRGPHVGHRQTDRFRPGESTAVVYVDDSGPGVPADHLEKLFDPFFTTKPTGVGTGLGLSVSREIVDMHGGTIELGNRPEGGVRATIRLRLTP